MSVRLYCTVTFLEASSTSRVGASVALTRRPYSSLTQSARSVPTPSCSTGFDKGRRVLSDVR